MLTNKELRNLRKELYLFGVEYKDIANELEGNSPDGKMSAQNVSNHLRGKYSRPSKEVVETAYRLLYEKQEEKRAIQKRYFQKELV